MDYNLKPEYVYDKVAGDGCILECCQNINKVKLVLFNKGTNNPYA